MNAEVAEAAATIVAITTGATNAGAVARVPPAVLTQARSVLARGEHAHILRAAAAAAAAAATAAAIAATGPTAAATDAFPLSMNQMEAKGAAGKEGTVNHSSTADTLTEY